MFLSAFLVDIALHDVAVERILFIKQFSVIINVIIIIIIFIIKYKK